MLAPLLPRRVTVLVRALRCGCKSPGDRKFSWIELTSHPMPRSDCKLAKQLVRKLFLLRSGSVPPLLEWCCFLCPICQARVNYFEISTMKPKRTPRKKTCIWFLIGLLSLASAAWSQAQTAGGTEKAVVALEQQWLQGQKANNPDLIAPLLADKIVVTEADGKVLDKAGILAFYKKQNGTAPSTPM